MKRESCSQCQCRAVSIAKEDQRTAVLLRGIDRRLIDTSDSSNNNSTEDNESLYRLVVATTRRSNYDLSTRAI
ncbi:MAG: hypothetical protein JO297_09145 [Nitrososphaeraceae archaeon]|nr:hypothetical protein [Nitrososphaeraceae archaeon]